jgi:hypothetical protein
MLLCFEGIDSRLSLLGGCEPPVPYSPPLEEFFLVSEDDIHAAARRLVEY